MYQRKSRRCCALMLLVSICLRMCMFLGLDVKAASLLVNAAGSTELARVLLYLETGQAAPIELPAETAEPVILRMESPQPKPEAVEMQVIRMEEPQLPDQPAGAQSMTVAGSCSYPYDKAALLAKPSSLDFSADGPTVLIVHTHGSEAYTPEAGWEYTPAAAYRTLEADRSVIAVGDVLAETLERYGIEVLHDRTLNDYPSYPDSYWTCLTKIEDWLQRYPSIQMVIDLHRDAVEDTRGHAVALSSTQEGQSAAQLMLVVGTDQGGLTHPRWQENLANALKLQSVLQGLYPGLCRRIDLRTERFNQHTTPGSILIEVGTNGNTLQQAQFSARLLGEGIAAMAQLLQTHNGSVTPNNSP